MKPKMKNPCTDEKFYTFIKEATEDTKSFIKTIKLPCSICEREYRLEDLSDCQKCGKSVCSDHAVMQMNALDDWEMICTSCCEDDYDKK